jgi:hypothetical protein
MQMILSAGKGVVKLMDLDKRKAFIDCLDDGTIKEEVISQANAGPMIMLSLFNDLQNPLFKQHNFVATEFLSGVLPALEKFHNVSGTLANQLRTIHAEARHKAAVMEDGKGGSTVDALSSDESTVKKPDESVISISLTDSNLALAEIAVLEHSWKDHAAKDPESPAGQLSRMVTSELLDLHLMSAKAASLLQADRDVTFKEDSCTVNHVALISARAFRCAEKEREDDDIEGWGDRSDRRYEVIDYDMDEVELKKRKGGVAAQIEVLYDVTQEFIEMVPAGDDDESKDKMRKNELDTTIVSVAVMEGWLSGGPDDELRWRIALHRPAFEFPLIQHGK